MSDYVEQYWHYSAETFAATDGLKGDKKKTWDGFAGTPLNTSGSSVAV
jgi:hypothetical protein